MAFATLQNRLKTSVNQAGTPCVKADIESGLLYCLISVGAYATVEALETAVTGYLGTSHPAVQSIQKIRRAGE